MKQKVFFLVACASFVLLLASCGGPDFEDNPHGPAYLYTITPTAQPTIAPGTSTVPAHLASAGFGVSLQALEKQYGAPTNYSVPPLYAFADGPDKYPLGSLVIVTMKSNRAVEFSYVPGKHPMTFQEAQDFAVKLLPDDAVGPTTIQAENDNQSKCLAKIYQSTLLKKSFSTDDFMSSDGKDSTPGTVTVNFFPNLERAVDKTIASTYGFPTGNGFIDHNTVSSVLINLGTRPSC